MEPSPVKLTGLACFAGITLFFKKMLQIKSVRMRIEPIYLAEASLYQSFIKILVMQNIFCYVRIWLKVIILSQPGTSGEINKFYFNVKGFPVSSG